MSLKPLIAGMAPVPAAFNAAVPGPIGGTTPAAITGTTITGTVKFVAAAGSAAAPSICAAANTDTGIDFFGGNGRLISEGNVLFTWRGGDSIDVAAFVNFSSALASIPNILLTDVQISSTITPGGTTGAQTINKHSGSVNFAALATSLVVTDSKVSASSVIQATVATNDSTMKSVQAVAGSGSFTLYANAAATAETRVNFTIFN